MKFISKIILMTIFIIPQAFARDIIVISYNQHFEKAQMIQKILEEQIGVPTKLIRLQRQVDACAKRQFPIVQLCVDENEEMQFVVFEDEVVLNSFQILLE